MRKRGEINKRRGRNGGNAGKREDPCHEGNADGVWRTWERGEMTSADFSRSKADVVLSRGCINPILLVILPDRIRESCNFALAYLPGERETYVTIEVENYSGQTCVFKYFPLTLLRFSISAL